VIKQGDQTGQGLRAPVKHRKHLSHQAETRTQRQAAITLPHDAATPSRRGPDLMETAMFRTATLPGSTALAPGLLPRLIAGLTGWFALRATQRVVEGLDAHLLRDIGLEPQPSEQELRRRLTII
jgi:uncharacterized protein YjiS (DUF1127 family)